MQHSLKRKFSILFILVMLVQVFSPLRFAVDAAAQETVHTEPTQPTLEQEAEVKTPPSTEVAEEKPQSLWSYTETNGIATLNTNLEEGREYVAPQNPEVRITFTNLPEAEEATLEIREVTLDPNQIEQTNAASDIAYAFATNLTNGTFTYDLTLPRPAGLEEFEVNFAESENELESKQKVTQAISAENNVIHINNLDHFTIFIVAEVLGGGLSDGDSGNTDCSAAGVAGTCYDSIQEAIDAVAADSNPDADIIEINDGTYNECLDLTGISNVTIRGESEAGTIIDTSSCPSYGFHIHDGSGATSNISISDLTLEGPPSTYGFKIAGVTDISLTNITAQNSNRTNVDFNGVNDVSLDNVTSTNTVSGNGIAFTDSNDVAMSNITTSGNAWGGIAVYTYGRYYPLGADNISLTGTNSISETNPIYVQIGNYSTPSDPEPATNLSFAGFDYATGNQTDWPNYTFYQETEAAALSYASSFPTSSESYLIDVAANEISFINAATADFVGSDPRYVRANNSSDVKAQLHVNNAATDVRFYADSTQLAGTLIGAVNSDLDRWRLLEPLAAGEYTVTGEIEVGEYWYAIPGSVTTYSLDTPWYEIQIPDQSGTDYVRPSDRFARVRIDDEFNQFESLTFRVFENNSEIGTYTVNRSDCDTREAGNYIICDLVRDFTGTLPTLSEGNTYYFDLQSDTEANNGLRYHQGTDSQSVTVDGSDPVINSHAITSPTASVYSDTVTVQANVTDAISGVDQVTFFYTAPRLSDGQCDPNEMVIDDVVATSPVAADTYEATFDTSALNGEYCFFVTARDIANSNSNPQSGKFSAEFDNNPPVVTVDSLLTNDTNPELTGTIDDSTATIEVTVASQTLTATNNGTTWTLADNSLTTALTEGVYDVSVSATDTASNVGTDATTDELTIDTTAPTVTVNNLITNDTTPALTGTIDDPAATVEVTVDGQTLAATNSGATWSLANNQLSTLAENTYDVSVAATDMANNTGTDATTAELIIDTTAPSVDAGSDVETNSPVTQNATIDATIAGLDSITWSQTGGPGTISFNDNTIEDPEITADADGTYTIQLEASDNAGNVGMDTINFTWDTTPPAVSVDTLETNDSTPELTGTIDDNSATLEVNVDGQVNSATNNGDGTWTLSNDTLTSLADGTYDVSVTATDTVGNTGSDMTTAELFVDATAPEVFSFSIADNDFYSLQASSLTISGDVSDSGIGMQDGVNVPPPYNDGVIVRVFQAGTSTMVYNTWADVDTSTGTYTLDIPSGAIADGVYDFTMNAYDQLGNVNYNLLEDITIDSTDPTVTLATLDNYYGPATLSTSTVNGTATDAIGVDDVALTVQRDSDSQYWNGTSWQTSNFELTPVGTSTWNYDATMVDLDDNVTYTITAVATDQAGNASTAATDSFLWDSIAPTVEAGSDVETNAAFTQNATVTDSGGSGLLEQTWSQLSGPGTVTFVGTSDEDPEITADVDGTYELALTGVDNAGNTTVDTFSLVWDTTAPILNLGDTTVTEIVTAVPDPSSVDNPESLAISYSGTSVADLQLPANVASATATRTAEITDTAGNTTTETYDITVTNNAVGSAIAAAPGTTVTEGTTITLSAITSNGNPGYSYTWFGDCPNTGTTTTTLADDTAAGDYVCGLTITDTDGDTDTSSVALTVNTAPGVLGVGDEGDTEDEETPEETTTAEETEGDVQGAEITAASLECEVTTTLTGVVYLDANNNETRDEGENGLENITVNIFRDGFLVTSVFTDSEGVWEAELCEGDYQVEIERDSLAANQEAADATLEVSVETPETTETETGETVTAEPQRVEGLDIRVTETAANNNNAIFLGIILLLGILGAGATGVYLRRMRSDQIDMQ